MKSLYFDPLQHDIIGNDLKNYYFKQEQIAEYCVKDWIKF